MLACTRSSTHLNIQSQVAVNAKDKSKHRRTKKLAPAKSAPTEAERDRLSVRVQGLCKATSYAVRATALNAKGPSAFTDPLVTFTTKATVPDTPRAPTQVSLASENKLDT